MSTSEQQINVDGETVVVIRSTRRTRTISADISNGMLRLRVPMRLSRTEVDRHARQFRKKLNTSIARNDADPGRTDQALMDRALALSNKYFQGRLRPASVTWSSRQQHRWGSTTSTTREIRLSARMRNMPDWVLDSVLVHELAHLEESHHGPAFQALIAEYPRTAEADAFLAGVSWANQHGTE